MLCFLFYVLVFGDLGGGFRMTLLSFGIHGVPFFSRKALVADLNLTSEDYFEYSSTKNDLIEKIEKYFFDDHVIQTRAVKIRGKTLRFCDFADKIDI